ncbi:MAG: TatD family hydrolase [Bdellovibrio sp.]|nr:TatD family hydrolase [Bdellovibrio sp.]
MKYIDSHSHWSDPRLFEKPEFEQLLQKALDRNIDFFLLGGINPTEWQNQITLKNKYPKNFGLCFGLHPYFVSDHEYEDCEAALDQLAQLLPAAMALGEAGLDFRPHIMKESQTLQIEMFENQIELAKAFEKPMVLHIVQAHDKAIQIFDLWDAPERKGFVHAFNGSYEVAKKYIDKGFHISVSGAVTFEKNRKLHDCIKKIPMEYLLLESDSPDQVPENWSGDNDSSSLMIIAEKIGLIRNLSAFDVLETSTANFKRLFRI